MEFMKILAIMGSPHKGNTFEKIKIIEEKLLKNEDVEFEIVNLMDIDLKPCRGCFLCFIKGDFCCPLKDDKQALFEKLDEADGVIFATPVYSMHVSYLMKLFIDRFSATFHRPRYFGKYSIVVAVAGNIGLKETIAYLEEVVSTWGFDHIGNIAYREAPKHTPLKIPPLKKDATDEIIHKFYTAIKEQKPKKLRFSDNITFRLMQTIYEILGEMSPYDYKYWEEKGWFDKKRNYFFENVKRNGIKDGVARFLAWIIGRQMEKEFAKVNDHT